MDSADLRKHVSEGLSDDPGERTAAWKIVRATLVILIFASVAGNIVGTMAGLSAGFRAFLIGLEVVAVLVFTVEYAARVWTAVDDRDGRYGHPIKGRIAYAFTPMAIIDLIAILPFYLSLFFSFDLLALRLLRLLRILKITRYSPALTTFELVIYNERRALASVLVIMMTLLILAASLLYTIEHNVQPEAFGSIPAAMWWAAVTLSTVGYGDVTPVSILGKVVAAMVSVLGIGMFAIPTAILGAGFARELQKRNFVNTAAMIARTPAFKNLKPAQLAELASLLKPRELPARYTITRKGDMVDAVYFIDDGKIIFRDNDRRRVLGKGESFGGLALLEGHGHEIAATTLTPCRILELEAKDFLREMLGDPELREEILQNMRERREHSDG